jgi:hypothetical protein
LGNGHFDNWSLQMTRSLLVVALCLPTFTVMSPQANAQACHRDGSAVSCDDGRRGILSGDAILWPDGTSSRATPHQSVFIGNKASVTVGPGVFVGNGKGVVPLDNPNTPNKTRCANLDGLSYCY